MSLDGLIGDIVWQVTKEGHQVKYYIDNKEEREIADGFVTKVDKWEPEVDWADVIVFDDVLGQGTIAHQLRQKGKKVVGGSPYTDKLEDDRSFGQAEMKAHGIKILPYEEFTSFTKSIEYVKANPGRYVIKPSGEAQNIKRLLFVGQEDDGSDVIRVLSAYKKTWKDDVKVFQLQKAVPSGTELSLIHI